jgi:hypothetical protein
LATGSSAYDEEDDADEEDEDVEKRVVRAAPSPEGVVSQVDEESSFTR